MNAAAQPGQFVYVDLTDASIRKHMSECAQSFPVTLVMPETGENDAIVHLNTEGQPEVNDARQQGKAGCHRSNHEIYVQ